LGAFRLTLGSLYSTNMRIVNLLFVFSALILSVSAGDYFKKIIKFVNSGDFTWKADHNHVTKMGAEAHTLTRAHLPSSSSERSLPLSRRSLRHSPLPKSFDSRDAWSYCQNLWSIKDQGNCGSCWAVSTSSVMSDRVCVSSAGATQVNISAEQLTACCVDCGVGCNGGYPDKAWPYFLTHGLVTGGDYESDEGCQPYQVTPSGLSASDSSYQECVPNKCTNKQYGTPFKKDFHYGKTAYYVPNDVASIQAEIMNNGPVVAGFTVYDDFFSYTSGVYQHVTGALAGGHAVRMLGWGEEGGTPYWLIANSWNRTWGDNGYVKFIRGINNCGIEEFITAGLVEPN